MFQNLSSHSFFKNDSEPYKSVIKKMESFNVKFDKKYSQLGNLYNKVMMSRLFQNVLVKNKAVQVQ